MRKSRGNHGELKGIKKEPGIKPDSSAPDRLQDDEAREKIISYCFLCVNRRNYDIPPSSDFRNNQQFKVVACGGSVHVDGYRDVSVFHAPRDTADSDLLIFFGQFAKTKDLRQIPHRKAFKFFAVLKCADALTCPPCWWGC